MQLLSILPLLSLSSLRTLELSEVVEMRMDEDDLPIWEIEGSHRYAHNLDPASHALENLALKKSYIETSILCRLIMASEGLKSFTYEHIQNDLSYLEDEEVALDYHLLATTLAHQASTLIYLHLDDEANTYGHGIVQVVEQLPALEELDIYLSALLPFASGNYSSSDMIHFLSRCFPTSSLRTVTIHCDAQTPEEWFAHYCLGFLTVETMDNDAVGPPTREAQATEFLRCLARRGVERLCAIKRDNPLNFPYEKYHADLTRKIIESAGMEYVVRIENPPSPPGSEDGDELVASFYLVEIIYYLSL